MLPGGLTEVRDYRQRRELFADIAKRSLLYFVVVNSKLHQIDHTQGAVDW
jgi:hypothetical protein